MDGTPANPQNISKILARFLAKGGCRQVSPHKLRHTLITHLISGGARIDAVSKLAGHSSIEVTLRIYTHYVKDTDNSKEVLDRLFG
jgi:integrase/recombinase XerC